MSETGLGAAGGDERDAARRLRTRLGRTALASMALYVAVALPWLISEGPATHIAASAVLLFALVILTVVDIEWYWLPDAITLPLVIFGVAMSATEGWDVAGLRLMAAGVGFGALYLVATVYERLRGQAGLGLGDAKLLAASGAWLGVQALASVVLLATTSALAVVGGMRLSGRQVSRTTMLPFGPFLAFGTWLVWLYGAFN